MKVTQSGMNKRHCGELHALGEGAHDQRRRDCGERHLEADVDELVDGHADREGRGLRVCRDALQEDLVESADECGAAREGETVAVDHPDQDHDADAVEHVHQHREHVLGAHQAAVEQRKARDRHQQDEHAGGHHPGVVALVETWGAAVRRARLPALPRTRSRTRTCRARCRGEPRARE